MITSKSQLQLPLTGKKIVVNPGHGGKDDGATYPAGPGGIHEKDVVLVLAQKLEPLLVKAGAKVAMTRNTDVYMTLPEIDAVTAAEKPDAFISIHLNAYPKDLSVHGATTYFWYPESEAYASIVLKSLTKEAPALDAAGKRVLKENFYVIDHTEVPAILVEVGYLSNDRDRSLLTDPKFQALVAQGLANGIIEFLTKP